MMCSRTLVFSLIFSFGCFHSFTCIGQELVSHDPGVQIGIESSGTGGDDPAWSNRSDGYPRILTVLTTYNLRTAFAKANREAMEEREDGYKSLMFITSDAESGDEDGAIDYNFGTPKNHRLLAAIAEAYARHKGEFDWMALGDDDTVFLYNRARSFLGHIDHTQPVAIGSVDGLVNDNGYPGKLASCFTPAEKNSADADTLSDKGCCQDFAHACNVPTFPNISKTVGDDSSLADTSNHMVTTYGRGGLYWPYGGAGALVSAGLVEKVQGDSGTGWDRCTEVFGHGYPTDIQVLGIHLGIRRLSDGGVYTSNAFKVAAAAVHREDQTWTSSLDSYMTENCPKEWEAISMWK